MAMDEQGLSDAAILLMSLGEEEAGQVLRHLSPREVQKIGETIAKTRAVSRERLGEVADRFVTRARAARLGRYPSWSMARWTRSRVSGRRLFCPLMTRETV